mmetsp:Transcript_22593/g.53413  ORF Transcript_22593/g.53413 Transcript_22593/m.53413 type:complete len:206 (+) Transcript_22593:1817-2434(+)
MTCAMWLPRSSTQSLSFSFNRTSLSSCFVGSSAVSALYVILLPSISNKSWTIAWYVKSCMSGVKQSDVRSNRRNEDRSRSALRCGLLPLPWYHHVGLLPTNSSILSLKTDAKLLQIPELLLYRMYGYSLSVAHTVTSLSAMSDSFWLIPDRTKKLLKGVFMSRTNARCSSTKKSTLTSDSAFKRLMRYLHCLISSNNLFGIGPRK